MKVGIVGIGHIGGSFARVYQKEGHEVFAFDRDKQVLEFAKLSGVVKDDLTKENISDCDLIIIAVFPKGTIRYLEEMGPFIGDKPMVIDCGGVKRAVCEPCFALAEKYHFTFLGGHPMAGTQYTGFKYSTADMFYGEPMVIVPPVFNDITLLERAKELLKPAGFATFAVTDAEQHDKTIAFSSQLAHIVSNAYIKSPTAGRHKGFSAGSYKDMTRVARLDAGMWAELFLENKDNLMNEMDMLTARIAEYRAAMEADDWELLRDLLAEGKKRKEEVDGI